MASRSRCCCLAGITPFLLASNSGTLQKKGKSSPIPCVSAGAESKASEFALVARKREGFFSFFFWFWGWREGGRGFLAETGGCLAEE